MALLDPELQQDRLYSKNLLSWRLVTTTAGYFAYDLYVHTARFEFLPSLVHAGAALTVFLSGIYCGILHYYGESPADTSVADTQTPEHGFGGLRALCCIVFGASAYLCA